MKIGVLHSVKQFLGNQFNAKLTRLMYEDWKKESILWRYASFYGQNTNRYTLRGMIYDFRSYNQEFQDFGDYSLIALSLNFDTYPSDFQKFVTSVINDLYNNYPILHQKEVIIMAGNEVFEKCRSAEKVFETCFDTKKGIEKSIKPDLPICFWNQGIGHSDTREAVKKLANSSLMQSICKYFGYQSLGTTPDRMKEYIPFVQSKGFEVVDVELGSQSNDIGSVLDLFHINKNKGVKKIFIMTPYISKELADYDKNFKNYALSIEDYKKEKFSLIGIVQHFKDKKKEVLNKMLDDIVLGICYRYGTSGWGVKRIQKIYNMWLDKYFNVNYVRLIEDGLFGKRTCEAIEFYQKTEHLFVDGIAGRETLTSMFNFMLKRFNNK